jgi:hypothetical protein
MTDSGLAGVGYQYVNLDDFWSTSVSALGMKAGRDYLLADLCTHRRTQTTGTISAEVPSHGVALFRMSPLRNPAAAPPSAGPGQRTSVYSLRSSRTTLV